MPYIKNGEYPINDQQIRQNHPNTSFPRPVAPHNVVEFGYEWVNETSPGHNPATEVATEGAPVLANGQWNQTWVISPKPVYVPTVVSMRQARLALLGAGLLPAVNAALVAMTGTEGEAARIEWEYAAEIRRDSALVTVMSGLLGITGAQLDTLFATACTL